MRPPLSWRLISTIFGLSLGMCLGLIVMAFAQAAPPPTPAPLTAEQQLDQAKATILQLREANLQCEWRGIQMEKAMAEAQKTPAKAAPQAAEKK